MASTNELNSLKTKWREEQRQLRKKLILQDPPWLTSRLSSADLLIGGLDMSFSKCHKNTAIATLAVINLKSMQLVYQVSSKVMLTIPYIATYLGYREVDGYARLVTDLQATASPWLPDVLMVDGNGTLHPRQFGCACQLGLQLNIPTLGVAKNLLETESPQQPRTGHTARLPDEKLAKLNQRGDRVELRDSQGSVCGLAMLSCAGSKKPIFVSPGHRISQETACDVVLACSRFRNPEPTRLADSISRKEVERLDNETI